jgi:hypothetical protein
MKTTAGPLLRWVGLLIEMASLLALVTWDDGRRAVAGVAVRQILLAGVVLGLVVWGVGLLLIVRGARRSGT